MKHSYWVRQIHLLKPGEQKPKERKALQRHLVNCPHCRGIFEELQGFETAVKNELSGEPVDPAPEEFTQQLMAVLRQSASGDDVSPSRRSGSLGSLLFGRRVEMGLQLASVVFLALFLIEHIQLTQSLRSLEKDMNYRATAVTYARPTFLPQTLKERMRQGIPQEWVSVVDAWTRENEDSKRIQESQIKNKIQELQTRFPRLDPHRPLPLLRRLQSFYIKENWRNP